jgi:small GTP-binding protein
MLYKENNKFDYSFKILFLGSIGVGKTSIICRYVNDIHKSEQKSTIGIDYKTKIVEYKSKKIKLKIFDTSGQERFRTLTKNYYQGSDGIIMVFDIKRKNTFEELTYWMEEINKICDKNKLGLLLIGNKNDGDLNERKISKEQAQKISNIYEFNYIETSAVINNNIKESFDLIIQSIFEKKCIQIDDLNNINNKQLTKKINLNKGNIILEKNSINNNVTNNSNNEHYFNCCH